MNRKVQMNPGQKLSILIILLLAVLIFIAMLFFLIKSKSQIPKHSIFKVENHIKYEKGND